MKQRDFRRPRQYGSEQPNIGIQVLGHMLNSISFFAGLLAHLLIQARRKVNFLMSQHKVVLSHGAWVDSS